LEMLSRRLGISPLIATVVLVSVGIGISIAVALWMSGILGSVGYGTRPVQLGVFGDLHGSGSMFVVSVKNFGSDDVFVDDIVIDGKYHSVITAAFETSSGDSRLELQPDGSYAVFIRAGETVDVYFTLELSKDELRSIFKAGVDHEVKIHTASGYDFPRMVKCFYIPHGSWTIREDGDAGDGWVLQGGHERWGAVRGSPSYHMYILRLNSWSGYNGEILVKARWVQGNDDIMVICGYDGHGNGIAVWTGVGLYPNAYTRISRFTDYGRNHPFYGGTYSYASGVWFWIKVNFSGDENNIDVKAKIWREGESEPGSWQLHYSFKPFGPYVGLGYWEDPHAGVQVIYEYDYFKLSSSGYTLELNFNRITDLELHFVEEG